MREATATPSEVRIPPSAQSSQRQARKNPRDTTMVTGSTPEVSQDPSSETEMVNYSSGEDEPGTVHSDVALYNNPRTCMIAETKFTPHKAILTKFTVSQAHCQTSIARVRLIIIINDL